MRKRIFEVKITTSQGSIYETMIAISKIQVLKLAKIRFPNAKMIEATLKRTISV